MVLPLVDESKPKCYMCYEQFNDINELREHQKLKHGDLVESHKETRESAPGDVTIF